MSTIFLASLAFNEFPQSSRQTRRDECSGSLRNCCFCVARIFESISFEMSSVHMTFFSFAKEVNVRSKCTVGLIRIIKSKARAYPPFNIMLQRRLVLPALRFPRAVTLKPPLVGRGKPSAIMSYFFFVAGLNLIGFSSNGAIPLTRKRGFKLLTKPKGIMYREYCFFVQTGALKTSHILRGNPYIDRFKILSVEVPISYYSTSAANNVIVLQEGATQKIATLPIGNHNAQSFPDALAASLNAVSSGYAVTYNILTRNLTITSPTAFSIKAGNSGTTAYRSLGLSKITDSPTDTSLTTSVVDLTNNAPLLLVSSELASHDLSFAGFENVNILASISTNAQQGSLLTWVNPGGWLFSGQSLSSITFQLLDSSTLGQIDLNGQPMSVVIGTLSDEDDVAF